MTSPGSRFCPRCGTARVAEMPFCPGCGLRLAEFDAELPPPAGDPPPTLDLVAGPPLPAAGVSPPPLVDQRERGWPSDAARPEPARPSGFRGFRGLRVPPGLLVLLIVLAGLLVLGILPRPQLSGSPSSGGQTGSAAPTGVPTTQALVSGAAPAPIVGLTILSPTDGQAVAARDVVIIGTAPPGLTVTQDISFGLDQHAKVDGTGHWAINVGLSEGDNKLTFRIGDDHSTQQTIRVIYTPQKSP